jgi:hypothetical protein
MEKSDPVNGWPQRAISLWDMMMMMMPSSAIVFRLHWIDYELGKNAFIVLAVFR